MPFEVRRGALAAVLGAVCLVWPASAFADGLGTLQQTASGTVESATQTVAAPVETVTPSPEPAAPPGPAPQVPTVVPEVEAPKVEPVVTQVQVTAEETAEEAAPIELPATPDLPEASAIDEHVDGAAQPVRDLTQRAADDATRSIGPLAAPATQAGEDVATTATRSIGPLAAPATQAGEDVATTATQVVDQATGGAAATGNAATQALNGRLEQLSHSIGRERMAPPTSPPVPGTPTLPAQITPPDGDVPVLVSPPPARVAPSLLRAERTAAPDGRGGLGAAHAKRPGAPAGFHGLLPAGATQSRIAGDAGRSHPRSAPAVPRSQVPPSPASGASAGTGAGFGFSIFIAVLLGGLALLALGASHPLRHAPGLLRPAPFISLLERPG